MRTHLVLICGHYEGVDERIRTNLATRELSIGDYILTGGELAAMVVVDAVSRFIPGVLGMRPRRRRFLFYRFIGISPIHATSRIPGMGGSPHPLIGPS